MARVADLIDDAFFGGDCLMKCHLEKPISNSRRGFTLTEMAIVAGVIGVIVGGVWALAVGLSVICISTARLISSTKLWKYARTVWRADAGFGWAFVVGGANNFCFPKRYGGGQGF